MSDPRNEDNEYGENDAMKLADMNTPDEGDEGEDPDMDEALNEDDDDMAVPGERQATRLPGITVADNE